MFTSRVERSFEAAHANGPQGHRCNTIHGHSWKVTVELSYSTNSLDSYGWGPDFGAIKKALDAKVVEVLDHEFLNDTLDFHPSAENVAMWVFSQMIEEFPQLVAVEIGEGSGNVVRYTRG